MKKAATTRTPAIAVAEHTDRSLVMADLIVDRLREISVVANGTVNVNWVDAGISEGARQDLERALERAAAALGLIPHHEVTGGF